MPPVSALLERLAGLAQEAFGRRRIPGEELDLAGHAEDSRCTHRFEAELPRRAVGGGDQLARLVEASAQRLQAGSSAEDGETKPHRALGLALDLLEPCQCARDGRGAHEERHADDPEGLMLLRAITGLARVPRRVLQGLDRSGVVAAPETERRREVERTREARVVAELLERADRRLEIRLHLGMTRSGLGVYVDVGERHGSLGGCAAIADRLGDGRCLGQHDSGAVPRAHVGQRGAERRQQLQALWALRRKELRCPLEEPEGCGGITAHECTAAGGGEVTGCSFGERRLGIAGDAELAAVGACLLQVVSEKLVELDELVAVRFEPPGESLVQLRADRLRHGVVGGVANQQVAEAEGVVPGKDRLVRPDELLSDERGQASRHRPVVRGERFDRAAVEHAPFHRAAFEHGALRRVELIEPCGEQGMDRGRHDHIPVRGFVDQRHHLLDEERIAFGRLADPVRQVRARPTEAGDHRVGLVRAERLEEHRRRVHLAARPSGTAVEQVGPCHAEQQDRRVSRQVGDMLDEIEERLLTPVDVVEDADEGSLGGDRLQQLPERPRDLLA